MQRSLKIAIYALIAALFSCFFVACEADFVGNKIYNSLSGTYTLEFSSLNRKEEQRVAVKSDGGRMKISLTVEKGETSLSIVGGDGVWVYEGSFAESRSFTLENLSAQRYAVILTGKSAAGCLRVEIIEKSG